MRRRGDELLGLGARCSMPAPRQDFAPSGRSRSRRWPPGPSISRSPRSRRCAAIPMPSTPDAFSAWRGSTAARATPALPSAARCSTPSCTALPRPRPTSISLRRAEILLATGRGCFCRMHLPADVEAVWWPRFEELAARSSPGSGSDAIGSLHRHPKRARGRHWSASTGVTLSGHADRIDLVGRRHAPTSSTTRPARRPPRRRRTRCWRRSWRWKARLLKRGAFKELGKLEPRIWPSSAAHEGRCRSGIDAEIRSRSKTAAALADEAWTRLEKLLGHYNRAANGYLSRALPFREGEMDGDYDHLARVLEWSAGGDDDGDEGGGE